MDDFVLARALHVLGVVLWIGGVGFVTTVLLPATRRLKDPEERIALFEQVEGRFAWQARFTTLLTGGSGFYMLYVLDAWDRYFDPAQWWLHAMTAIWLVFTLMLFLLEPLFLHAWFERRAVRAPESTFALIQRLHWLLLSLSLLTVAGAIVGVHVG
ncbi:MAG: hypothetical protein QF578_06745 [Alphaproteobacteria bacterium]|jgi:uncharacterized membrane protein|nr:hypothetical protein [Alphaproteobacteria bacterium]MDP6564508.1 hypothetical protein [Alphaproteobacteria bacterium]MDP6814189.1 hypothetical protein [Alphaproteobacteria bacterium]